MTVPQRQMLGGWRWWHTPDIPALGRWRQGDWEYKASLSYIVSLRPVYYRNRVTNNRLLEHLPCSCQALGLVLSSLETWCGDVSQPSSQMQAERSDIAGCIEFER